MYFLMNLVFKKTNIIYNILTNFSYTKLFEMKSNRIGFCRSIFLKDYPKKKSVFWQILSSFITARLI